jgi:hypothetical protein
MSSSNIKTYLLVGGAVIVVGGGIYLFGSSGDDADGSFNVNNGLPPMAKKILDPIKDTIGKVLTGKATKAVAKGALEVGKTAVGVELNMIKGNLQGVSDLAQGKIGKAAGDFIMATPAAQGAKAVVNEIKKIRQKQQAKHEQALRKDADAVKKKLQAKKSDPHAAAHNLAVNNCANRARNTIAKKGVGIPSLSDIGDKNEIALRTAKCIKGEKARLLKREKVLAAKHIDHNTSGCPKCAMSIDSSFKPTCNHDKAKTCLVASKPAPPHNAIADYDVSYGRAIKGHNEKHLSNVQPQQCAAACNNETWCASFDFYKGKNACDLSKATAHSLTDASKKRFGMTHANLSKSSSYDHYYKRNL